jgi:hypothetical protein
LLIPQQMSSRARDRQWCEENYDHTVLDCSETNRTRCHAERLEIQSAIFCR